MRRGAAGQGHAEEDQGGGEGVQDMGCHVGGGGLSLSSPSPRPRPPTAIEFSDARPRFVTLTRQKRRVGHPRRGKGQPAAFRRGPPAHTDPPTTVTTWVSLTSALHPLCKGLPGALGPFVAVALSPTLPAQSGASQRRTVPTSTTSPSPPHSLSTGPPGNKMRHGLGEAAGDKLCG